MRGPREDVEDAGGASLRARRPRGADEDGAILAEALRLEHAPHGLRADHAPGAGAEDAAVDDDVAVEPLALQIAADLLGQQFALALLHHGLHLLADVAVAVDRLQLLLQLLLSVVREFAVGGDVLDDVVRAVVLEGLELASVDLFVPAALGDGRRSQRADDF